MTRKFWGLVMLMALGVTLGAAYFWFNKMSNAEMALMETGNTPPTLPTSAPEQVEKTTEGKPAEPVAEASTPVKDSEPTRNILFSFPRASAKSVFIVGDFNDWHREPLMKKDNKWQITLPLTPGTYKYQFVVDEKHMRDPNNKNSADGKSLINVKPISPKQ